MSGFQVFAELLPQTVWKSTYSEIAYEDGEQSAEDRVDLAVMRTELTWDRTLSAWLRTTLAFIGAEIAFAQGTKLLHEARVTAGTALVRSGHLAGLALIGTSSLLLAAVGLQYWQSRRDLAHIGRVVPRRFPLAMLGSLVAILLGCAVFVVLSVDRR